MILRMVGVPPPDASKLRDKLFGDQFAERPPALSPSLAQSDLSKFENVARFKRLARPADIMGLLSAPP